jgi:hypothetical protein
MTPTHTLTALLRSSRGTPIATSPASLASPDGWDPLDVAWAETGAQLGRAWMWTLSLAALATAVAIVWWLWVR